MKVRGEVVTADQCGQWLLAWIYNSGNGVNFSQWTPIWNDFMEYNGKKFSLEVASHVCMPSYAEDT